jgi:hypothetical protein
MRSTLTLAVLALLLSACGAPRPWGQGVSHYTTLWAGYRAIDHPVADGGPAYGLEIASADERGWGYELVGNYAAEETGGPRDHDVQFGEYGLGLRRTWQEEGGRTTLVGVGGVITKVDNTLHGPRSEFEDNGAGGYAHAAVLWSLDSFELEYGTATLIGLDLRGLIGDDYDYVQLALVFGLGR